MLLAEFCQITFFMCEKSCGFFFFFLKGIKWKSFHHCFHSLGFFFSQQNVSSTENAKTLKSEFYTGIKLESFHTRNQIVTKITGWHMEDKEDVASAHWAACLRKRQQWCAWLSQCVHQRSLNCDDPHRSPVWEETRSFSPDCTLLSIHSRNYTHHSSTSI